MDVGSIPTGGLVTARETETDPGLNSCCWRPMLATLTQLVYFAPRKRMFQVSTPTGAALCSNRAQGAHGRALTAGGAICCFAACVDGCLAAALRARVLGRSVSQSVTSPMGSVKSGAAVQTSLGHVRICQAISFRSGTAAGHHLLVATTSAPSRSASLAQLAEHALRKCMVVGSIPTGG